MENEGNLPPEVRVIFFLFLTLPLSQTVGLQGKKAREQYCSHGVSYAGWVGSVAWGIVRSLKDVFKRNMKAANINPST